MFLKHPTFSMIFQKHISRSENIKIFAQIGKKSQKMPAVHRSFETPNFKDNFSKTQFPIGVLKLKSKHSNLASNFETNKNVGDNFLISI